MDARRRKCAQTPDRGHPDRPEQEQATADPFRTIATHQPDRIGISYSFDALFKANKKIKQARVETKRMEENRRLLQEEIENEIHTAYVNLNEAYIRLRTQQKSVQLSHENYNIVHQRYLNGLALITDMLDASNTQLDMELQLSNYQIGILYQYYLLRKIAGIL